MTNPTAGTIFTANGDGTSSFLTISSNSVTSGAASQILITVTTTLSGTFSVTNGSPNVTATTSQNSILVPGNNITFSGGTGPASGTFTVFSVTGTAVVLTTNYTNTTSTGSTGTAPFATWTTLTQDVTNAAGVMTINSISGSSPIAITPSTLQFTSATTIPTLNQATAASGTGAVLKIQAQNITSGTGGALTLTSGTGTTAGAVILQTGGTTRLTANATGVITIANLSTGVVHSDGSGNLTSSSITVGTDITGGTTGQVLITNGTTPTWTSLSSDVTVSNTGVTTVNSISGSTPINITPVTLQWTNAVTAPKLTQVAPASVGTTPGTAATTLTITSQAGGATTSNSGTGGNGGTNTLAGGTGGAATTGTGTNTGGVGGGVTVSAGQGGAASGGTVGNNGGNGGNIVINSGTGGVGTGTGATTGTVGNVLIQTGGTTIAQATSNQFQTLKGIQNNVTLIPPTLQLSAC